MDGSQTPVQKFSTAPSLGWRGHLFGFGRETARGCLFSAVACVASARALCKFVFEIDRQYGDHHDLRDYDDLRNHDSRWGQDDGTSGEVQDQLSSPSISLASCRQQEQRRTVRASPRASNPYPATPTSHPQADSERFRRIQSEMSIFFRVRGIVRARAIDRGIVRARSESFRREKKWRPCSITNRSGPILSTFAFQDEIWRCGTDVRCPESYPETPVLINTNFANTHNSLAFRNFPNF